MTPPSLTWILGRIMHQSLPLPDSVWRVKAEDQRPTDSLFHFILGSTADAYLSIIRHSTDLGSGCLVVWKFWYSWADIDPTLKMHFFRSGRELFVQAWEGLMDNDSCKIRLRVGWAGSINDLEAYSTIAVVVLEHLQNSLQNLTDGVEVI